MMSEGMRTLRKYRRISALQGDCIAYMVANIGGGKTLDQIISLGRKKYVTDEKLLTSVEFGAASAEFIRRMDKMTPDITKVTTI